MILTYDTDELARMEVVAAADLHVLGCATKGCSEEPAYLVLVRLIFINGDVRTVVQPHCRSCTTALQPRGHA